MLHFLIAHGDPSIHELLITIFLFLTAPVIAHMGAKAHILRDGRLREELPATGRPADWAAVDTGDWRKTSGLSS